MKLTVLTYGTEGDTRPLAFLCRALMDAGHEADQFFWADRLVRAGLSPMRLEGRKLDAGRLAARWKRRAVRTFALAPPKPAHGCAARTAWRQRSS